MRICNAERKTMKTCLIAILVATGFLVQAAPPPNIILILSDDHAPTAIGCYGKRLAPFARTPNIDRLAAEGVRLDSMYCVNAICGPSRASILTGQYGHVNGVTGNGKHLAVAHPNVAKELGRLGYQSAVIGKWHLHERPSGFSYYEVLKGQGKYFSPRLYAPGDGDGKKDGTEYTGRFSADVISERAVEWLKNREPDKPFVLMAHFKACHGPRSYPDRVADLYNDIELPEPATLFEDESGRCDGRKGLGLTMSETSVKRFSSEKWATGSVDFSGMNEREKRCAAYQKMNKDYLRCTAALDEGIGNILEYVENNGLMDDTVIIYCSDQGYYLGEHNYIDKRWFFEEGVNMPFVVRYPRLFKAGMVNDDITLNIDIAPFLLELAGGRTPEHMQGRSFVANLQGKTPTDWRDAYFYHYWDQNNRPAHYGIQTKDHRLIFFYGLNLDRELAEMLPWAQDGGRIKTTRSTGYGWELYDLKKDPLESQNVFNHPEYREVAVRLAAQMDELRQELGDLDEHFPELLDRRRKSGL